VATMHYTNHMLL